MPTDIDTLIKKYDDDKYNTSLLKTLLGKDEKAIAKGVKNFEKLIGKLKSIESKYIKIKTSGEKFSALTGKIDELLKEPERIKELLAEIKNLEKEKKEYLKDCKNKLKDDWNNFDTGEIDHAFGTKDFEKIYTTVSVFEKNLSGVKGVEDELEALRSQTFGEEYQHIKAMLNNPLLLENISDELAVLKEKVSSKKAEIKEGMEAMIGEGFIIANHEEILENNDIDSLINTVGVINANIGKLATIEAEIDDYYTATFAEVYENIKSRLKDVLAAEEIEASYTEMKNAITGKMTELKQMVMDWKNDNFNVEDIEDLESFGLDGAGEKVAEKAPLVEEMRSHRETINSMKSDVIMMEVNEAIYNSSDLNNIETVKQNIVEIEERIEEIKETYKKNLEEYRDSGYNVSPLDSALGIPLDEMAKEFEKYANNFKELSKLMRRNVDLKTDMFENEYLNIKDLEKDPTQVPMVRDMVNQLEGKIAQKLKEFRDIVIGWETEGFDTEETKEEMTGTLDELKELLEVFGEKIKVLKALESSLKKIWSRTFEEDCGRIKKLLRNVNNIETVEGEIEDLKTKMEQKKEEFRTRLEGHRNDGYDVSSLESIVNGHIDIVSRRFDEYEKARARLEEVVTINENLKCDMFRNEYAAITVHQKRPDEVSYAERKLAELQQKINDIKTALIQKYTGWKDEGYDVAQLEGVFSGGDLDDTYRKITAFGRKLNEIKKLEERFAKVDSKVFEEDSDNIRRLIKSTDNIDQVKELLPKLEAKDQEKRHDFRKKLERYRTVDNMKAASLENVIRANLSEVAEAFMRFGMRVDKLKAMKKELEQLSIPENLLDEKKELYRMLNDPDRITEIREAIDALKKKI